VVTLQMASPTGVAPVEEVQRPTVTSTEQEPSQSAPVAQRQAVGSLRDLNEAMVSIADSVRPSVVTVFTERVHRVQRSPFGGNPFGGRGGSLFDQFFREFMQPGPGGPPEEEHRRQGLGSGVIVSADGYILTNNHVIAGADQIRVRTLENKTYDAKVIGTDSQTDIAVIKIDAKDLHPVKVGDSDQLRVGEIVLAVGSPMSANLAHTVTQGIVSAKGRSNVGLADYEDFIQTDAAVNPGNSGGALVNLDGELVGINTAIVSRSGGFQGISFAVPINMGTSVQKALIESGRVVRGWLGVLIQDISEDIAKAMSLPSTSGVLVADITEGGPAEKIGLRAGDVILDIDGETVNSGTQLRNRIASTAPGTEVKLRLWRDGKELEIQAKLESLPTEGETVAEVDVADQLKDRLGFSVSELSPQVRSRLGLSANTSGVVVAEVERGTAAFQAGVRPEDVIVSVNRRPVTNIASFQELVGNLRKGQSILLQVVRSEGTSFIAFSLQS